MKVETERSVNVVIRLSLEEAWELREFLSLSPDDGKFADKLWTRLAEELDA